jgi:hypothetical protein
MSGRWPFHTVVGFPWGFTSPASKDRSPGSPFHPMLVYAAPLALVYSASSRKRYTLFPDTKVVSYQENNLLHYPSEPQHQETASTAFRCRSSQICAR